MDPINKESTPFAHKLYMSKQTLSFVISVLIVLIISGGLYWFYKKNSKPKKTQIEQYTENVAQRAASIKTTPEEKQKMVEDLKKQESFTVSPKEVKNADEDLVNEFLKNQ